MNKLPETLYHITKSEYLPNILTHGLTPLIGERSSMVEEDTPMIYLSDKESLPHWLILIGGDIILQIDTSQLNKQDVNLCEYDGYNEYRLAEPLPACCISQTNDPLPDTIQAMKIQCIGYVKSITYVINHMVGHYARQEKQGMDIEPEDMADFLNDLAFFTYLLDRLDYAILDQDDRQQIRDVLKDAGDSGLYTPFDTYFDEDKRLWEKLIEWQKDDTYPYREKLYQHFKTDLAFCHDLNTGGFCF